MNEERDQTLNQLLTELDGFEGREGVMLLAATNRAEVRLKLLHCCSQCCAVDSVNAYALRMRLNNYPANGIGCL